MKFGKFKNVPKDKTFYAVTAGSYLGKFLLFINPKPMSASYDALAIGQGRDISSDGFEAVVISKKDVEEGLKKKILDKVEKVPKDMYNVYYQEWLNRKSKLKENNEESDN